MGLDYTITLSIRNAEECSRCLISFNQFSQPHMLKLSWTKHSGSNWKSPPKISHNLKTDCSNTLQYHSAPIFNGHQASCFVNLVSLLYVVNAYNQDISMHWHIHTLAAKQTLDAKTWITPAWDSCAWEPIRLASISTTPKITMCCDFIPLKYDLP